MNSDIKLLRFKIKTIYLETNSLFGQVFGQNTFFRCLTKLLEGKKSKFEKQKKKEIFPQKYFLKKIFLRKYI